MPLSDTQKDITKTGAVTAFLKKGTCSESLFHVLNRAFDAPMSIEEKASAPLAGGIMQHGYQCGMIWGSVLAAGVKAYQLFGLGAKTEAMAILAAQRIVNSFRNQNKHINCQEITELGESASAMQIFKFFLLKGGAIGCFRMAARFAPVAFDTINTALSEEHIDIPAQPVSCAAILARKMGASDEQAAMAAGLAGGIGLCGGACGSLGAAIWLLSMTDIDEENDKIKNDNSITKDVIERFLKCTDYKFECSKIVGRRFESFKDHSEYLKSGGCAALIETLATK